MAFPYKIMNVSSLKMCTLSFQFFAANPATARVMYPKDKLFVNTQARNIDPLGGLERDHALSHRDYAALNKYYECTGESNIPILHEALLTIASKRCAPAMQPTDHPVVGWTIRDIFIHTYL